MIEFEHTSSRGIRFHEYANLFPMLEGDALDRLREDIREHGVCEPIVFDGDVILDGRNRYMCARELGIEYPRVEFTGDNSLAFVISHNLHRRHLTESQRASIAARLAKMPRGGALYRSANLQTENEPPMKSAEDAANMLNVSERSVATARKVHDTAPPEIVKAVDDGRLSVSLAGKVADLPDEAKADIISAPPDELRDTARDAVKRAHVSNNSGNNEWYTPEIFITAARNVMGGIDLDPASSEVANRMVQATRFFTAEDDGLKQEWSAGRIWMNPPYSQPLIGEFSKRLVEEVANGAEATVLVNNATETAWFQRMAEACSALCFPRSRVRFLDPEGNPGAPLQGQAVIYCGPNVGAFSREFETFGVVVIHG